MKTWFVCVTAVVIGFFSTPTFAKIPKKVKKELKENLPHHINVGSICEQLARIKLKDYYPDKKFYIHTGISYQDRAGTPQGELDVVIFDRSTQHAVLIGEVKCSKNLKSAKKTARRQRSHFKEMIQESENLIFFDTFKYSVRYQPDQFDESVPFIFISQKEGDQKGFDLSLDQTLPEIETLTEELLAESAREAPRVSASQD